MKTVQERYNNDPAFRTLVLMFYHFLIDGKYTPSELREASVFAATLVEQTTFKPLRGEMEEVYDTGKGVQPIRKKR